MSMTVFMEELLKDPRNLSTLLGLFGDFLGQNKSGFAPFGLLPEEMAQSSFTRGLLSVVD